MFHLWKKIMTVFNKKKLIYVKAFVYGNLGDDLFIKVLTERYPQYNFVLVGAKEFANFYREEKNLVYYSYDTCGYKLLNGASKLIKKCDFITALQKSSKANVYITGSDFIESSSWKPEPENTRNMLNFWNKKLYVLGINFGPFRSQEFLDYYKRLCKKAASVCVRETQSFECLKGIDTVSYAPDVVFNLKYIHETNIRKGHVALISVIDPQKDKLANERIRQNYIQGICRMVDILIENGKEVVLVSFCKKQGDLNIAESIKNKISKQSVRLLEYDGNISEILAAFYTAEMIVATRYHAMVLGMMFSKPLLPIVYDKKMSNVLNDLNYDWKYLFIKDMTKHVKYEEIMKELLSERIPKYRFPVNPEKQFEEIEKCLEH